MKKLGIYGLCILFVAVFIFVGSLEAQKKSGKHGKSNEANLLLVSKDTTTWEIIPGAWGSLKYNLSNPNGFEAHLQAHGLLPNEWYMVTFQGPAILATCNGLWGGKSDPYGNYTDVAFFHTNRGGNANVFIPTAAGLSGEIVPLIGLNTDPTLADGLYQGVTVVVKYVGDGNGWFDPVKLIWGTDPVLFEYQPMEDFTVGY